MSDRDKLLRQLTGKTAAEIDEIGRVAPDDGTERRTPSPRPERQDPDQAMAEAFGLDAGGGSKPYTLRRDAATGNVVEMSSDGPDDHARMMEAIRASAPVQAAATPAVMPSVDDMRPTGAPPPGVVSITLKDAADKYLATLVGKDIHPSDEKMNQTRAKVLLDFLAYTTSPKIKLYSLRRDHCAGFHARLRQVLEENTAGNKMLWLSGFFEWAQTSGYYPRGADHNPATGFSKQNEAERLASRARGWESFDRQQLRTIFDAANFERLPLAHSRWIVLLALYTGARSNELAYLELPDIRKMEGLDLWVLDFNIRGKFKSVKNRYSDRRTPIHPDLIGLGLLERVDALKAQGEIRLFPESNLKVQNGPASATGTAFSRLLVQLGIEPRFGKLGIHSLRDTVITELDEADVPLDKQEAYSGHVITGQKSTQKTDHKEAYSSKSARVAANLAKDCHPPLNWAQAGVVDIAAIKPLLFETKQPNPRHVRKR